MVIEGEAGTSYVLCTYLGEQSGKYLPFNFNIINIVQ